MKRQIAFFGLLALSLFFRGSTYCIAQNTCPTAHILPAVTGQLCPGGVTSVSVNQFFNPTVPSTIGPNPGCGYSSSYDDNWHRAIIPANAGGIQVDFSGIRGCEVGGFLTTCYTELEIAAYSGSVCNALTYYGCLEVGYGSAVFGTHVFSGAGGILLGGYPGDTLWFRGYELNDDPMEYWVDAVTPVPPGSFCSFPLPLSNTGCNHGSFGSYFTPPGGCWQTNENTIFYTFDVTPSTPQPVQIDIFNISCTGGAGQLQMAIYDHNCNTIGGTGINYHGHACGIGNVTLTANPNPLPVGNYILAVDGDAGSECTWDFSGNVVLEASYHHIRAKQKDQHVALEWETGQELNNQGWHIERALDGENWEDIGFVQGAGNSNQAITYSYQDFDLVQEIQHYRLRQVDMDGSEIHSYSVQALIEFDYSKPFLLKRIYPQPAGEFVKLEIFLPKEARVSISILDVSGREVYSSSDRSAYAAGNQALNIDLTGIVSGIYLCRVKAAGYQAVQRIVIGK